MKREVKPSGGGSLGLLCPELISNESGEIEGGAQKEVIVARAGDGIEGFLRRGGEFKKVLSVFEGDHLIVLAMDDEKRGLEASDVFEIGKAVAKEDGDIGDGAEGAEERRDEDDGVMLFLGSQPAGGAGADGLADEDDLVGLTCEGGDEVVVGYFDGTVAAFFRGLASAPAVSGKVVGDDAVAGDMK